MKYGIKRLHFKSGSILISNYIRSDLDTDKYIKSLIRDIYTKLPSFNLAINWVSSIEVNEGYTADEVLREFGESKDASKGITFCQLGQLFRNFASAGSVDSALALLKTDRDILFKSGKFMNIIWNRTMTSSYGNSMIFILKNHNSKKFIADNIGDNNCIINRIVDLSESK